MKLKHYIYNPAEIAQLINDHLGANTITAIEVHNMSVTSATKYFYNAGRTHAVTLHSEPKFGKRGRPFVKVTLNRYNSKTGAKLSPHFHQFT